MNKNKSYFALGSIVALILVAVVIAGVGVAHANQSSFMTPGKTGTATSSPIYLLDATATTTAVVYDSYNLANGAPLFSKVDSAVLLIQVGASSTAPVMNVTYEYAHDGISGQDCSANQTFCDWYSDELAAPLATPGTSASVPNIRVIAGINGTTTKAFNLPMPTRYVRVRVKAVGAPANVWAQIVPARENTK